MKCVVCDKPAKWRWSPDLDIQGIGSCTKHKNNVEMAYIMLLQGTPEMYEEYIKGLREQPEGKYRCACSRNGVRDDRFTKHTRYECGNSEVGVLKV